jgi:hypothetical protein
VLAKKPSRIKKVEKQMSKYSYVSPNLHTAHRVTAYEQGFAMLGDLKNVSPEPLPN